MPIKYVNDGLPEAIYNAIVRSAGDYDYSGPGISVTRLIDSPYIYWLAKNYTVEVPASKAIWALFGTMIHNILEKNTKIVSEYRVETEVDGIELTGKADAWLPPDETIDDYKFLGWQSKKAEPKGKKEYRAQLNILRWLFIQNGIPITKLRLHYLYRNLSEFDLLKHETPDKQIETIDVEIMSNIEEYIKNRIKLFKDVVLYNAEPSVCTLEERWGSTRYAVVKQGNSKATKVFDDVLDAQVFAAEKGAAYYVEYRANDFVRCKAYCSYNSVCRLYQENKYQIEKLTD